MRFIMCDISIRHWVRDLRVLGRVRMLLGGLFSRRRPEFQGLSPPHVLTLQSIEDCLVHMILLLETIIARAEDVWEQGLVLAMFRVVVDVLLKVIVPVEKGRWNDQLSPAVSSAAIVQRCWVEVLARIPLGSREECLLGPFLARVIAVIRALFLKFVLVLALDDGARSRRISLASREVAPVPLLFDLQQREVLFLHISQPRGCQLLLQLSW